MGGEKLEPKFALVTVGRYTHVFLDGKCISEGIDDITYYARNEKGELRPTVDMKINVQNFSFTEGQTLEEFFEKIRKRAAQ